jgi:hypothetical protein
MVNTGWRDLRNLANVLGQITLPSKKQEAALVISEYLQSSNGFKAAYLTLTRRERLWLQHFLYAMQTDGYALFFPKNTLYSWFVEDQVMRQEAELALMKLQELGFMGKSHNWYASESMEFADELLPFLYETLYEELFVNIEDVREDVQVVTQLGVTFSRDIVRFLSLLAQRTVGFTKNNVLYKREVGKVLSYFRSAKTMTMEGTGVWEGFPGVVVIAVKQLLSQKLIRLDNGKAVIQGQQVEQWLQLSAESLWEWMNELTYHVIKEKLSHFNEVLMMWLRHGKPGIWVPIQAVFAPLSELFPGTEVRRWEGLINYFVIIASTTGVIDYGVTHAHGLVVRIAQWPLQRVRGLYAQPNLELFVPEEAPLALHFLAGHLADFKQADVMSTYQLSKERILQLCDRGWGYDDIAKVLELTSETPVASSVLKTIRDWVASYNRAVLWDAMFVHFQSSEWFYAFIQDKRSEAIIAEMIGDIAVIIKRNGEKIAREVLADIGAPAPVEVRKPHVEGTAAAYAGSKMSKLNAQALSRVTGVGIIDLLRMKLSVSANVKQ